MFLAKSAPLVILLLGAHAFGADCDQLKGEWNWFTGGVIRLKDNQTILYNGAPAGKWECADARRGTARLHWTLGGFVDTVTVSGDRISGSNRQGTPVSATRKSDGGSTPPAPAGGPVPASGFSVPAANAYVKRKDFDGLLAYSKAWTQAEPSSSTAWFYLGNTYGTLDQPQNALPAFQKASQLKSPWPEAWNALGCIYAQLKQFSQAVEAFRHATEQNSKKITYWNNLAAAYTETGDFGLAQNALDEGKGAAAEGATWKDWYVLGNGYSQLKMLNVAVKSYQRSVQMNGRFGPAWNNLGAALQENGDFNSALDAYKEAAQLGEPMGNTNLTDLKAAMEDGNNHKTPACDFGCVVESQLKKQRDFDARQVREYHWAIGH